MPLNFAGDNWWSRNVSRTSMPCSSHCHKGWAGSFNWWSQAASAYHNVQGGGTTWVRNIAFWKICNNKILKKCAVYHAGGTVQNGGFLDPIKHLPVQLLLISFASVHWKASNSFSSINGTRKFDYKENKHMNEWCLMACRQLLSININGIVI